jgi:hypothetical protein
LISILRKFGHIKRMDEHEIPTALLQKKMSGKGTGEDHTDVNRPSYERC